MKKLIALASAAAVALAAPGLAKPEGKGGKGGGGGGGGHPAHAGKPDKVKGGGKGGGGGFRVAERPRKAERRFAEGGGGKGDKAFRKREFRDDRGGRERAFAKADKAERKAFKKDERAFAKVERKPREERRFERRDGYAQIDRGFERDLDRRFDGRDGYDRDEGYYDVRPVRVAGFAAACPPGLAKKNEFCLPPGQAKKRFGVGERLSPAYFGDYNVPDEYRDWYRDTPDYSYRYDDGGYIYRTDRGSGGGDLVSALIPLLGGGFGVGQLLPAGYDVYNLPAQYRDTYQDSADASYRYGDDAIYEVDPQTGIIESIVALLAGGNLGIGDALPEGYDSYNLPLDYRDQYQDSDEAMYRYADGNIYQADPQTGIIEAIISALG